jgi:hypothetical protein
MMGVKPTSSLADVRRAYKNLALICHPDKGGNATDMRILKMSYDWICSQLEQVQLESEKGTYEEREAEFKAFLVNQETNPLPSFTDIEIDTLDIDPCMLHKLKAHIQEQLPHHMHLHASIINSIPNDLLHITCFDDALAHVNSHITNIQDISSQSIPTAFTSGYGEFMIDTENCNTDEVSSNATPIHPYVEFEQQMLIIYQNQEPYTANSKSAHAPIPFPSALDDYSVGSYMTDYKLAHSDTSKLFQQIEDECRKQGLCTRTQEQLLHDRSILDTHLQIQEKTRIHLEFTKEKCLV